MKCVWFVFTGVFLFVKTGAGDGFLKPVPFPKTFKDIPLETRIEILREGYMPYRIEYDANGVCVSGCAYQGITIKEDMQAVDEATDEMADLIQQSEQIPPESSPSSQQQLGGAQQPPVSGGGSGDIITEIASFGMGWCYNGLSTKLPLRYPVDMTGLKYKISSDFGFRTHSANGARFHPALDIGCPSGTPVYATADGIVVTVANETKPGGAGNYINIKHENGLITQYLHLNSILVSKGERVSACQQIATSGNTGQSISGQSYAAHLDYRIRFDSDRNKYVDILCPCKTSNRNTQNSYNTNLDVSCAHSLFNAHYKFKNAATKHSKWRVEHGHCMQNIDSLLPDEISQ